MSSILSPSNGAGAPLYFRKRDLRAAVSSAVVGIDGLDVLPSVTRQVSPGVKKWAHVVVSRDAVSEPGAASHRGSGRPQIRDRTVIVVLNIRSGDRGDIEDEIDDLTEDVEAAIYDGVPKIRLRSIEIEYDANQSQVIASALMEFEHSTSA